ncbi:hypothetical protein MMPV_009893 [Pyropia vietnamensis]
MGAVWSQLTTLHEPLQVLETRGACRKLQVALVGLASVPLRASAFSRTLSIHATTPVAAAGAAHRRRGCPGGIGSVGRRVVRRGGGSGGYRDATFRRKRRGGSLAVPPTAVVAVVVAVATVVAAAVAAVEAAAAAAQVSGPPSRSYFLRATLVEWDYAPLGNVHACYGRPLTPEEAVYLGDAPPLTTAAVAADVDVCAASARPPGRGSVYTKPVWVAYTDATFTSVADPVGLAASEPPGGQTARGGGGSAGSDSPLGILGPPLYVATGEVLVVTVSADTPFPVSFEPSGVMRLGTRRGVGGGGGDTQGMLGGAAVPPGEVATFYFWVPPEAAGGLHTPSAGAEANVLHAINGYTFCHGRRWIIDAATPTLWHALTAGGAAGSAARDIHTLHLHGLTGLTAAGGHTDVVPLAWRYSTGWIPLAPVPPPLTGITRHYYLAAEQVAWDYTAGDGGVNACTGVPYTPAEAAYVSPPMAAGRQQASSVAAAGIARTSAPLPRATYVKTVYVAYTDATIPAGLGGPLLTATVGDTMVVTLLNSGGRLDGTPHRISIHPHGLRYTKASEGAAYADGTSGVDAADDAVAVGNRVTVKWEVPERSGPGPSEGSGGGGKVWLLHSHVAEVADTAAGLFGA